MSRALTLALTLAALCPMPALAAPSIELLELPEKLVLPLPPGTNRLFAVRITAEPAGVWLAASADAGKRLALQPAGGKWMVNLGDRRIGDVLAGAGQFQIFAEVGGETIESLPVIFTPALAARPEAMLLAADGTRVRGGWIDPAGVDRIAIEWSGSGPRSPLTITAGAVERPVAPGPDGKAELKLDDALRKAWQAADRLEMEADGAKYGLGIAIPGALGPAARESFRIGQRRSLDVPGSRGYLVVHLGDISGTRVPVTITGADGTAFVEHRLMAQGERAEFALGGARYALVIDKLVNMLMGEDHAELHVEPAAAALQK